MGALLCTTNGTENSLRQREQTFANLDYSKRCPECPARSERRWSGPEAAHSCQPTQPHWRVDHGLWYRTDEGAMETIRVLGDGHRSAMGT
jgi:hypothetical protein